ncbi:hypothetical protein GTB64_004482 [Salmonella enterica]|nr:hypothetical protein [Salmonella enterica]
MRKPLATDFIENIEGIGRFRFARRTMADEMKIQRLFSEYTGGVDATVWLLTVGEYLSTLRVLIVEAPEGWDIENLDPLEDETYEQMGRVFVTLREREETFRRKPAGAGEGAGAKDAEHGGSLVSENVPASA